VSETELIPRLFRSEFRKITSVLCKYLGVDHIELAEDIASETFLTALETWPYKGVPENPVAWLYTVARNKTRNYINYNPIGLSLRILCGFGVDEIATALLTIKETINKSLKQIKKELQPFRF
jgi:RNA polymerase sigma-70 factor (ECF subfamily)